MRELSIKLNDEEAASLEDFARLQGVTMEEAVRQLVVQYRSLLQMPTRSAIHEEVKAISGIVPPNVEAKAEYGDHFARDES